MMLSWMFSFGVPRKIALLYARWFANRSYNNALKKARKRFAKQPSKKVVCVSARRGKLIYHFYKRET